MPAWWRSWQRWEWCAWPGYSTCRSIRESPRRRWPHPWMAGCRRCCCCCLPTAAMKPRSTRWARRAIPRRDAAFALFVALLILTALYALLQLIMVGVLADAAHSARPLADAARVVIGPAGAALISAGALISAYGYISANLLTPPRRTVPLAEPGDFRA